MHNYFKSNLFWYYKVAAVCLNGANNNLGNFVTDDCDVTVPLDHNTARLLYQCMKRGHTDNNHRLTEQLLAGLYMIELFFGNFVN